MQVKFFSHPPNETISSRLWRLFFCAFAAVFFRRPKRHEAHSIRPARHAINLSESLTLPKSPMALLLLLVLAQMISVPNEFSFH